MKMTPSIIEDYEKLEEEDLLKFAHGVNIHVKSGYEDYIGTVTRTPWFSVTGFHALPDRLDLTMGVWWIEVDGRCHSLEDYNVIPNSYNNHSLTVLQGGLQC